MRREFLLNVFFLLGVNLLIKPFYLFGIERTVQNTVGQETYGIYFTLLSLTYLLQALSDLGIQNFNNRHIAQHRQLLDKYFPHILGLKVLLSGTFLVVLFTVAFALGYRSGLELRLLAFLGLNQVLISLIFYLRTNLSALGFYRLDSWLSALDKLLLVLIGSALLFTPLRAQFRIEWFAYAQTAALLLTALVSLGFNARQVPRVRLRFRRPVLLLMLKKSLPFALVLLLMSIYTRIDAVMLRELLPDGARAVGVYAAAYRLLDAGNMLGFLFAGLLLPMFARLLKARADINPLARLGASLIWIISGTAAVLLTVFRTPVMQLLYTEATPYWGQVLGTLIWTFPAVCGTYIYGTLLTANGRLAPMNYLFAGSIGLNVLLNALLIPRFEAVGAALATDITQWGVLIGQILLATRLVELRIPGAWVLRVLGFMALTGMSAVGLSVLNTHWLVAFIGGGLAAIGWAFVVGLVRVDLVRRFLAERTIGSRDS